MEPTFCTGEFGGRLFGVQSVEEFGDDLLALG